MVNKCLNCNNVIVKLSKYSSLKRKYCNHICGVRFTQRIRYNNGLKLPPSKECLKNSLKKNYEKNKQKWFSRKITRDLLIKHPELLNRRCKFCQERIILDIHHEEYSTKILVLKQLISDGKIYFLCKNHHGIATRKKVEPQHLNTLIS